MLPEVKLYKHQDKTVEFYKTKPAILNSSEPGTGKTLTVIKHCEGMGKVLIVCPSFLCLNWKREFKLFAGEDVAIWPQTARVTLFSVDSIWRDAKPFMGLDLLVCDECFTNGTRVETPNGQVEIQDIKVGDTVVNCTGEDKAVAISSREYEGDLYTINSKFTCTANHLILTSTGWKHAKDIQEQDSLVSTEQSMQILQEDIPEQVKIRKILLDEMWGFRKTKARNQRLRTMFSSCSDKPVKKSEVLWPRLLRGFPPRKRSAAKEIVRELWERVSHFIPFNMRQLQEEFKQNPRMPRLRRTFSSKKSKHKETDLLPKMFLPLAFRACGIPPRLLSGKVTHLLKKNRPQAFSARGKWERTSYGSSALHRFVRESWRRVSNGIRCTYVSSFGQAASLQVRLVSPFLKYFDRNRRIFSQRFSEKNAGQVEGRHSNFIRVESITAKKCSGVRVYNIQVERHPSYSVEGVLVHNCTYISATSARRTRAFHEYVKLHKPKQLILMSGTPIKNRITELYSTMLLLDYYYNEGFRRNFSNRYSFNHYFSNPVVKYLGRRQITQFEGQKNVDDLKRRLAGKWIKFTLQELEDLPDIIYDEISAEVKETKELAVVERELEEGWTLMELGAPPSGGHISTLKMESAIAKVPFAISLMKDLLDQGHGPLIVFSDHRKPVEMICEAFDNSEMIRGDTPNNIRETIVRQFQSGKIDVLVGTIKAMGIGWTLTSSNTMVMLDRSWVVSENEQAVGRIYRASQKRRCHIIEIVRPGVDTRISRTLRAKEKVIKAVGL